MKHMAQPFTEKQSSKKLTKSTMPGIRMLRPTSSRCTRKPPYAQILCVLMRLQRTDIVWRHKAIESHHAKRMMKLIDKWGSLPIHGCD